jgi:hypothetical protein
MSRGVYADEFRARIASDIARCGQHLVAVFASETVPEFVYTIGNAEDDLAELLFVGGIRPYSQMLNDLGDMQRMLGRAFADGERVRFEVGKHPVKLIAVPDWVRDELTIQAGQYWGHEDYLVRLMVLSDQQGRFPGEPGCAAPYSHQLDWLTKRAN